MRSLMLGIALTLAASSLAAQRVERAAVDKSVATPSASLVFASTSLRLAPADMSAPWTPPPAPAPAMGMDGGRILYIAIGAVLGAAAVYGVMSSIDCSDCKGDSRTYGAAGGAVVGGFIGSAVWGMRQHRATVPPPPK